MIEGVASLLAGMRSLLRETSLRAVLWRILLLLLFLLLAVGFGVYGLAEYLAALWLPQGDAWYVGFLSWLVWVLAVLLALFTGAVSFTILGSVAAAPWLDMLAARAEVLHCGAALSDDEGHWMTSVLHSLSNVVRPLFGLLLMGLLALAVLWIPLLGPLAATLIWAYAGIRFLNYELLDVPASRRRWDFARRKAAFEQRRFFWLGFGGLSMALLLVPLVNLLVLPAAVVALTVNLPADKE